MVLAAGTIALLCQCNATESRPRLPRGRRAATRLSCLQPPPCVKHSKRSVPPSSPRSPERPSRSTSRLTAATHPNRAGAEAPCRLCDPRQLQALETPAGRGGRGFRAQPAGAAVSKTGRARNPRFAELPRARRIVVGAPEAPIGRYTLLLLDRAELALGARFRSELEARVVSRELNVRQVLAKLSLGEADAGIVYRSDLTPAHDRVTLITIPAELNVVAGIGWPLSARRYKPNWRAASSGSFSPRPGSRR